MNRSIQDLLKIAEEEQKKIDIPTRKFSSTEDGKVILNPNKSFDKDWYENDEMYDVL